MHPQGTLVPCVTTPNELDVVAPPLHVYQEPAERGAVDDVRAPLGALAVADGGDTGKIGGDFHAAAVVGAEASLAPDSVRQVDHFELLHSLGEFFEVHRGVPGFERCVARP